MKTIRRPISILLAVLMVVGMFTVLPISASAAPPESGSSGSMETGTTITPSAAKWTFKLNSNFSGEWNADTDVVSEQPVELNLAAGDYEFQIVAYEDGNLSSYRGNVQAGSFTETYSQVMHDNGGNAKFHADGGKYTLTYNAGDGVLTINPVYVAEIDGTNYKTLDAAIAAAQAGDTVTLLSDIDVTERIVINKDITITGEGNKLKTTNAAADCMFIFGSKDHKLTISNTVLDGNNLSENAIWTQASGGGSTQSAEVTLTDVTVQNFKGYTYVGAVYLFSNAVGNFNNCVFSNNATPSNSDDGLSGKDIWAGAKATVNINKGTIGDVYLHGGSASVTIDGNATVDTVKYGYTKAGEDSTQMKAAVVSGTVNNVALGTGIQLAEENFVAASTADLTNAPAGYKWVDSAEDGKKTLAPVTYVAKIGDTGYATLADAFAAAQDGDTITLLANCTGDGIKVAKAKFATKGLTVNFNDHTYTVDGETVGSSGTETIGFQLLKGNKITFQNGTITGNSNTNQTLQRMIQNYSDLTLYNMTVSMVGRYNNQITVSTCNGKTVINNSKISAPDFTWAGYDDPADVGAAALAVGTFSSYPSIDVTVEGDSTTINGDVNVSDSNNKKAFSLKLNGGKLNGKINLDENAKAAIDDTESTANVTKADSFTQEAPEGYEWKDNGDGTSTLAAIPYVAKIGDTKYETLEAAFAAAADGETITVLADCAGNGIKVPAGKFTNGLTVDFGGKTYTVDGETVGSSGTETNGFQLLKNNKITFTNGTITSAKAKILVQNYSNLTLDGMTLTLDNQNYTSAYTLSNNNGNTVIKDSTINANRAGGFAFDVCRFSSYPSVKVTVTNSTINGDVEISATKGDAKQGFSLTLESGSMSGNIVVDASAQALVGEDNKVTKKDTFTKEAPEGFKWVSNEDGTSSLAPIPYVAKIGDTKYETLDEAIEAAQTGDTITLLDDIALTGANWFVVDNKDLTIDLGGKNISSEDSVFVLKNGADLTVKNGTMTTSVSGDYAIYVNNGSVFTLNNDATLKATNSNGNGIIVRDGGKAVINGTVESGYYSIAGFGSAVVDVNAGASITSTDASALSGNGSDGNEGYTFNINGGTLTSVNDVAIYHPNQGALNITGGTITGATAIYVKSGSTDISTSTTSISGATITGNGAAKELVHSGNGCNPTGDAIVIENCGYPGGTPAIDISGGTIVSENADPVHSYGYNDYEPIEKFVSGGTFNKAVPADYAADGYIPVDNGDGTYTVDGPYVAAIGTTGYATLEAAFAAAVDGNTIKVLADSAGNGIQVLKNKFKTKGLTVDFDGHTYTMDGETVGSPGTKTQAFQLQYNNKITFKNGTLYSEKALFLVQNYSNLTLDGMTLTLDNPNYAYGYTLSNNYGNTVIKDTTINANPAGKFAFDVCRGGGSDRYTYVNVTVEGNSVINGNVEVDARNGDPKNGFSLNLESGTLNGAIKLTADAETAIDNNPDKASVNKKNTFTQDPAAGYKWKDNGDGTSTLVKIPKLFAGNGLALHGDIGVIFYLNPEAAGFSLNQVSSVSVDFACDKYSGTVTEFTKDDATGCIKVAYYVPVAYMASDIIASNVKINNLPAIGTDTYSVQDYALDTINDPNAPAARKTLMKEMLNYGAKAKAVFESQMANPEDAVYEEIPDYTKTTVTVDMIDDAIEGEATDMSTVTPEPGAKFYGSSVIYLSETTLRMVFAIPDGSGSKLPENAYTGHQGKWYHWVDKKDIPAAQLHKQQTFTVGNATFNYSALDYAKAVLNSNMDQANKDLVSAMYLYNQAAIACFA